jgi:hypothetical protein
VRNEELGVRNEELGVRSEELGVRSEELGVRSEELGVRSEELGVRSEELGVRSERIDDCVIVHRSKCFLIRLIKKLRLYLMSNLGLTLHPKKIYLQPCARGVTFLGCFIKPSHIVVHHRTVKNFTHAVNVHNALARDHKPDKEEVAAFISSVNSYLGIMKHYRTYRKRETVLRKTLSPLWYKHIAAAAGYCKITKMGAL